MGRLSYGNCWKILFWLLILYCRNSKCVRVFNSNDNIPNNDLYDGYNSELHSAETGENELSPQTGDSKDFYSYRFNNSSISNLNNNLDDDVDVGNLGINMLDLKARHQSNSDEFPHESKRQQPFTFGIGKRYLDNQIMKKLAKSFNLGADEREVEPFKFGVGKRKPEPFTFGLGKRAFNSYRFEAQKKQLGPFTFGVGKRGLEPFTFGVGKRYMEPFTFGVGKRRLEPFTFGVGKRRLEPFTFGVGKRRLEPFTFGVGKRGLEPFTFGVGKRGLEPFTFGVGKRGLEPFTFGVGKRPLEPFTFGVGKRGVNSFDIGLDKHMLLDKASNELKGEHDANYRQTSHPARSAGKREMGPFTFGVGKRRFEPFTFGVGKRKMEPFTFGVGKRQLEPFTFGVGKRKTEPFTFGVGKRIKSFNDVDKLHKMFSNKHESQPELIDNYLDNMVESSEYKRVPSLSKKWFYPSKKVEDLGDDVEAYGKRIYTFGIGKRSRSGMEESMSRH